eukprot:gnl/Chilomastix_cuspidata/7309.p1 GENE.gnl/Chilomastix_cuspidata/7309~~gnl/Chilomastix_cuspidata/7309.p1  ORF type:complete len:257 (+),score=45.21 gnl/Chilomastix_cuspidata/7309:71-772(+)
MVPLWPSTTELCVYQSDVAVYCNELSLISKDVFRVVGLPETISGYGNYYVEFNIWNEQNIQVTPPSLVNLRWNHIPDEVFSSFLNEDLFISSIRIPKQRGFFFLDVFTTDGVQLLSVPIEVRHFDWKLLFIGLCFIFIIVLFVLLLVLYRLFKQRLKNQNKEPVKKKSLPGQPMSTSQPILMLSSDTEKIKSSAASNPIVDQSGFMTLWQWDMAPGTRQADNSMKGFEDYLNR